MATENIWHLRPAVAKWSLCMSFKHNGNCGNSKMCYCTVGVYTSGLLALSSDK